MQARGYASLLRQLRELERRKNRSYEAQALTALAQRVATIEGLDEPDEVKARLISTAEMQWETFMQRPLPGNQ